MKTQQIEQNTIMQFIFLLITIVVMTTACKKDELVDPIDDNPVVELSSEKAITSFVLLQSDNFILPYDIVGQINEAEKTITLTYPYASLPTRLIAKVETSATSIYSPTLAQDFTNPVEYTITAEDGSSVKYTVKVNVNVENTEREVLQAILDANPSSRLDWDLSGTVNLDDLTGVELNVFGKIGKLYLHKRGITNVPKEIGKLVHLERLGFFNNSLTSVPAEIGNLVNLKTLNLNGNKISNLPAEIGNLVNLESLKLRYNSLTSIPSEIGFLHKLRELIIDGNNLSNIPFAINNLVKRNSLRLFGADGLPSSTTDKDVLIAMDLGSRLHWGVNNYEGVSFDRKRRVTKIVGQNKGIEYISTEIASLAKLKELIFDQNNIRQIPSSFVKLKNVTKLNIMNNPIESIPSVVCDLQVSNGGKLTILADPGEGCD